MDVEPDAYLYNVCSTYVNRNGRQGAWRADSRGERYDLNIHVVYIYVHIYTFICEYTVNVNEASLHHQHEDWRAKTRRRCLFLIGAHLFFYPSSENPDVVAPS